MSVCFLEGILYFCSENEYSESGAENKMNLFIFYPEAHPIFVIIPDDDERAQKNIELYQ